MTTGPERERRVGRNPSLALRAGGVGLLACEVVMRRSVWVGGLVLALLVASLPARADAPPAGEKKAETATADKIREELAKPNPDYEEVDKQLEELLKKTREDEAKELNVAPPSETLSEAELRDHMDRAVEQGKYDQAAYYLDRIKLLHDKPNPFGGWLDLTIWTIVVFLLLLWVLGRFAWKPMLQGLQKREEGIHRAVEDARLAREEAQRLRGEVQTERTRIEETRRETIQKAEADAQRRADEIVAKAKAEVQAERGRMRRDLETARDQALQELWSQTANLAAMVSSKAIRRNLTPEDHRRFVDEALAELRQTNGHTPPASA